MLQYDNSAFYFFALSTISFYLVPSWYGIILRFYNAFVVLDDAAIGAVPRTSVEKMKAEKLKKESKGWNKLMTRGFIINFSITIVFTVIFLWLLISVSSDGEVNSFDPFAILEIDTGADLKLIKKAYKKLSLKWHPDKNPDNRRVAEAKFMMISKAYEALTNEEARENWEKYGNPDGKQSLQVSIGLPSFLLDGNNRNLVLVTYLLIMVGLIPFCVWLYYSDSSKYGEKNVMYDTYSWFHHSLSEHTAVKNMPEIMAGSAEFRKRNAPKSPAEKQLIGQLATQVRSQMLKPKYNHPVCVKGNVLLHTHLLRKTDLLTESTPASSSDSNAKFNHQADLKFMLQHSTALIDAMISVCKYQENLQTVINVIEFGQYMTQAIWVKDSPLLQLPHFTAEEVKHCEKGKIKISKVQQYRDLSDDQKKGMANFTEEQKQDVMNYLKIFPNITVETKVYVDDDEDNRVYEGDLCTIEVIITRHNLEDHEKAGYVHAPRFPFPKKEAYWVLLGQVKEKRILSIEKVGNPNKKFSHKIKFMAPPKGHYDFDLFVKSNAYIGIDVQTKVELNTLDNSVLPEYKVHPDDAQLDDEPTLFEEMLNANIEQDSDDEDEDENDENDADDKTDKNDVAVDGDKQAKPKSAAAKKREKLRKARQANEDDDDDDDDDDNAVEVYAD